ncbi:MAG: 3-deoxy-7-phosphoheptulonate synthase [Spirochaetaceae bacterium]|jgi:3-deoxy-7-phosphoheptulonate synthase|nr:3-deoxy-7-phosphoheptulonate synthase [Spirochaetaceae bacterium]
MIVALSKDISPREKAAALTYLKDNGFSVREQELAGDVLLIASGGTTGAPNGAFSERELALLPGVARVASTSKPYQLAARETRGADTIVSVGGAPSGSVVKIGGARICVIAGPCAVESREQIAETAARVRESGAVVLRGGAYKPRTSPYAFQGLGMKGLEYMKAAGDAQGMPIVTEVVSPELADGMKDLTDIFQIGARNMQNFELLKRVGSFGKPVLLKRGASATIEEWLLAAEYLLAAGTKDVMLCERGIRTFETYTRNTLDISAIPVLKRLTHLPVIVDPSHAVGIRDMVPSASLAAVAAGADGLTVEVHPTPDKALSDGPQSLYPEQFERLMRDIEALSPVVGKELLRLPRREAGRPDAKDGAEKDKGASVQLQTEKAAFCGENGAYSGQALDRAFGEDAPRIGLPSFAAVFDAVLDGSAAFGIVPVENSLTGTIHENYDLFTRYPDVAIAGELKLRIVHCLIAAKGASLETIKTVRSHSQGFAQCREFLDKHPNWRFETWNNTAAAVHSLASGTDGNPDLSIAAIASESAANLYGLSLLKTGIETNPQNYTRFVIIARRGSGETAHRTAGFGKAGWTSGEPDKASLVFSIKDEPGSLYPCLQILNTHGLSMTKLESRPILGQPWNYMFYVDISTGDSSKLNAALGELENQTESLHFLGMYRAAV